MVLFFITTLLCSLLILSLMLGFKRYELTSGHVLLGTHRENVSRFNRRLAFLLGTVLPQLLKYEAHRLYRALWSFAHMVLARVVVKVEQRLEGLLRTVQERTTAGAHGEASAFLREVVEHKKKLAETSEINRIEQE